MTLVTWLLILALYVTRRALIKDGRRVWGDFAFPLLGTQFAAILLCARIASALTQWTLITMGLMTISAIGTALVYDRRNNEKQFMLKSGILFLVLTAIVILDMVAVGINIWR